MLKFLGAESCQASLMSKMSPHPDFIPARLVDDDVDRQPDAQLFTAGSNQQVSKLALVLNFLILTELY